MSETTGIKWCDSTVNLLPKSFTTFQFANIPDAVGLDVFKFVAWMAKRYSIGNVKAQIREGCERFDMMCSKISAAFVSALLAGKGITHKHGFTPVLVTRVTTRITESLACSILPIIVSIPARIIHAPIFAHSALCFLRQSFTETTALAFERSGNLGDGFSRVATTLKRGWLAFSVHANLNAATSEARGVTSIAASFVVAKVFNRKPSLTTGATLATAINKRLKLLKSNAGMSSGYLHCA